MDSRSILLDLDPAFEFLRRSIETGHCRFHLRDPLARYFDPLLPHAIESLDGPSVLAEAFVRRRRALEHRRDTELRLAIR
jgi:hypothetical protein